MRRAVLLCGDGHGYGLVVHYGVIQCCYMGETVLLFLFVWMLEVSIKYDILVTTSTQLTNNVKIYESVLAFVSR